VVRFEPGRRPPREKTVLRLPSCEQVKADPVLYAHASRVFHLETNPGNARALVQAHGDRLVCMNCPIPAGLIRPTATPASPPGR